MIIFFLGVIFILTEYEDSETAIFRDFIPCRRVEQ